MLALKELDSTLDKATIRLSCVGNDPAIEVLHYPEEGGVRIIRGKMDKNLELKTVSTSYMGDAPKWGISKAEAAYVLQRARDKWSVFGDDYQDAHSTTLPAVGAYFSIEGHKNFLKKYSRDDALTLRIACGTENNTYYRTYTGKFYELENSRGSITVFLDGARYSMNEMDGRKVLIDSGLFQIFSIPTYARFYHTYR
ncbi:hypothetical protein ACK8P5_26115 (plasmid) [Paenibacillus sp. EC2-1]|uniref:hypothetical protein n=1 Tax=Paenibacillus sp. EC2-1 TaxID=3388665 RepID=UPI003BEF032B